MHMMQILDFPNRLLHRAGRVSCIVLLALGCMVAGRPLAQACTAQINAAASVAYSAEVLDLAGQTYWWTYWIADIKDRLVRIANANGQDTQSQNTANSTNIDKSATDSTRTRLAKERLDTVSEFTPSRLTCSATAEVRRAAATKANYNSVRQTMTVASTRESLNAPGTPAEKGALQGLNSIWKERCNTYFNPTTTPLPAGMTCPAAPANMVDLDITPWRSIFLPINIPGTPAGGPVPPEAKAAADTIRLLIEPVPTDPIRGTMMVRNESQNIHIMRMRDLSRLNLARGALEDIVARRTSPTVADTDGKMNSRLARYIEMISGQGVTGNNVSGMLNSIIAAGESQNAQVQSIAARMQTEKMMLADLLRFVNEWQAIEAVKLGMTVEKTRGGNMTSSMINVKGN